MRFVLAFALSIVWKLIGFTVGLLFKGPLGAALGLWVGWWLDRNINRVLAGDGFKVFAGGQHAQAIFQRALFGSLGHLAKADGRVTEREIAVAEQVMNQLHLNKRQRQAAVNNFRLGKSDRYPLERELEAFFTLTRNQPHLRRLFIEILLNGALADGVITDSEQQVLHRVAQALGMSSQQLNDLIGQRQAHRQPSRSTDHPDPYRVLGVDSEATEKDIKQAYRRLMSRYHPDKMSGREVPVKMREYAHEQVRVVRAAYDQIRKQRNFR